MFLANLFEKKTIKLLTKEMLFMKKEKLFTINKKFHSKQIFHIFLFQNATLCLRME